MHSITIKLDYKIISMVLAVIILVMLGIWQPWTAALTTKTITVSGTATVKSLPDEYVFSPSYEKRAATEKEALAAASTQTAAIIDKLKDLGVADKDIATAASAMGMMYPYWQWNSGTKTATTTMRISVSSKDLAEKVQAYLVTTDLTGSASPQASFSESRRKALEAEARTKAIADAKQKATQMATELGVRVGKAQTVTTGGGFGEIMPMAVDSKASLETGTSASGTVSTTPARVYTGQNEITASVSVVYALR